MAKRHVVRYFIELENEYLEMQNTLNELQKLAQEGKVEESSFLEVKEEVEKIKQNYDRVAYIIYLLNKPNRKDKEDNDYDKSWYQYLKTSSKEVILDETRDALSHLKAMVKEMQKNG